MGWYGLAMAVDTTSPGLNATTGFAADRLELSRRPNARSRIARRVAGHVVRHEIRRAVQLDDISGRMARAV
jgi:hypothetical protein